MVQIWGKQNRVIVDFDFKTFHGKYDDFQIKFSKELRVAWSKVQFNHNDIHTYFSCSSFLENLPHIILMLDL